MQEYLGTLLEFSIVRSAEAAEEMGLSYPVTFNAKLEIDGVNYLSSNAEAFASALQEKLPSAKTFILDCTCSGVLREYFHDEPDEEGNARINMIRKDAVWSGAGMLDKMEYYNFQTEEMVVDSFSARWLWCERCESIKSKDDFSPIGRRHRPAIGICTECARKMT